MEQETKQPEAEPCRDWAEVVRTFDSFRPPSLSFDLEGEISRDIWIFRGLKSADYNLEPTIEWRTKPRNEHWAEFEPLILGEFQSKARLYKNAFDLPVPQDKLSWLALMQHYGVPTRLLDFTYSPYLALYFALRARTEKEKESPFVKVWAIDGEAVMRAAQRVSRAADKGVEGDEVVKLRRISNSEFDAERASLMSDDQNRERIVSEALSPTTIRRRRFNESGFVALALPSIQNLRLSNQQGVFLFNGAGGLSFQQSLFKMMAECDQPWCRLFQMPASELSEIEKRLFQMNIHDLALFPDTEGLAGFINQKIQLHWLAREAATGYR